jgi:hypothetical protein
MEARARRVSVFVNEEVFLSIPAKTDGMSD